jgi:hypothetical protein
MLNARTYAAMFREADRPFRPRHLTQYWVVQAALKNPLLAVEIYAALRDHGGTETAAQRFMIMLEQAQEAEFRFWWFQVFEQRRYAPLPG